MALLFLDGFDHSGTTLALHATKYNASTLGSAVISAVNIRTGTGAFGANSNCNLEKYIPTIPMGSPFIAGFAFYKLANTGTTLSILSTWEVSVTNHIGIAFLTTGQIGVYRNTTATMLATAPTPLASNTWYYIELKGVIHDTTGSFELRIDGTNVASATNVDTRNVGSGILNSVIIGLSNSASTSVYWDDYYICDGNGPAPYNDFLGPIKVETLLPQTDAVAVGSNAGLTPSTGTDRGALVDEIPPNTTDYNSGSTVGVKDTYQYPNATLTGTIVGIQTNLYAQKTDAGARSVAAVVRTNSVDYDGANASPLTTFSYLTECRTINPNTGVAWTTADINAIQVGMKVTV